MSGTFGNPIPGGTQGSTPYPLANDLMLTYSGYCSLFLVHRSSFTLPFPLLLPVAPLNLIKKLPPTWKCAPGCKWSTRWSRCMQIINVVAFLRVATLTVQQS